MQDYSGHIIERYLIKEKLGQGGMAVVYKAFDTRLERDVALKLIRTDEIPPIQIEALLKRFEREAKSQARFSHPNIVPVYDYGEHEGVPYLVMEYLENGTLRDRMREPIPLNTTLAVLAPIAAGLAYAHGMGVIHRDIKPSNILFNQHRRPMLTDFGIAKLMEADQSTLTGTGLGVGTPEYMAPEQWKGEAVPQTDIYALGVVMYEMLTGVKPYTADTPLAVAVKQMTEPIVRPSDLVSDIPSEAELLLFKTLSKKPEQRYQSMQEFHDNLVALRLRKSISYSSTTKSLKQQSAGDTDKEITNKIVLPEYSQLSTGAKDPTSDNSIAVGKTDSDTTIEENSEPQENKRLKNEEDFSFSDLLNEDVSSASDFSSEKPLNNKSDHRSETTSRILRKAGFERDLSESPQRTRSPKWLMWALIGIISILGLIFILNQLTRDDIAKVTFEQKTLTKQASDQLRTEAVQTSNETTIPTSWDLMVAEAVRSTGTKIALLTSDSTLIEPPQDKETPTIRPTLAPTQKSSFTQTPTIFITPTPQRFALKGCSSTYLKIGFSAFISYEGGINKLRETASTIPKDNIIGEIEPGEIIEIIDGPVCELDRWVLWKVRTTDNKVGWTPETNGEDYWLQPIATRKLCTNALPTRLLAGKRAFVQEYPPASNRIRKDPNTNSEVLGYIKTGEMIFLLEGPICGESANWWKVQSISGDLVGWTMESLEEVYYLAPIP